MEGKEKNPTTLKKVTIVLVVLLLLTGAALGASYLYRHLSGDGDNGETVVPQSLMVGEDDAAEAADQGDGESGTQAGRDGAGSDIDVSANSANQAVTGAGSTTGSAEDTAGNAGGTTDDAGSTAGQTGGGGAAAGSETGQTGSTGSTEQTEPTAPYVELYKNEPYNNERFSVQNMLPGDVESRYYCVRVHHDADIKLFFGTEVTNETRNLGDVLKLRVTNLSAGEVIYDGSFSDLDGREFSRLLKANGTGENFVYYQMDAYLDTSVGNEYQQALLQADFNWYVKDDGSTGVPEGQGTSGLTPKTGDTVNLALWITLAICAILLAIILVIRKKKGEIESGKGVKLYSSIGIIVLLAIMLSATSYALMTSMASITGNSFETGRIKIDLNGGEPIFDSSAEGSHMNIEPGHTLKRDFYVQNEGSADAWYRIYMQNVSGDLSDILIFTIYDENGNTLYTGTAAGMSSQTPCVDDEPLAAGETRYLTMTVKMPESAGNTYQNGGLSFDMTADAVQMRNNAGKEFE